MNRRAFLSLAAVVVLLPLPAAITSMVNRFLASQRQPKRLVVPSDQRDPVTFVETVVVTREQNTVHALSARCTHLGCLIDRTDGRHLVCPCHGSRFHNDGTVASGPAVRPLVTLPHEIDPETGALLVDSV